jgi:hypothetical protein
MRDLEKLKEIGLRIKCLDDIFSFFQVELLSLFLGFIWFPGIEMNWKVI